MFIEILLACLFGICLGIITGLIPGIHVNLISVILLALSAFLLDFVSALVVSVVIISMAITHTFLDTIPSIFLGAPDPDTALSILPGHRLLLEGYGYEAVMLTIIGSLGAMLVSLIFVPGLLVIVEIIYPYIKNYIGYFLILVSCFLIFKDKNRIWALTLFLLSGALGIAVLNLPIKEPLFPLFSGLFGISMLLVSLNAKVVIPKQVFGQINSEGKFKAIGSAFVVGWICSFMPGMGPAQAAIIGSQFVKLTEKGFLILVGGLSTVNMVLSLVTLFVLGKARNGAVVVVSKIIEELQYSDFWVFISIALIVGGIATFLACNLSKVFSRVLEKVNYKWLCIGIICFITVLVFVLTGFLGFFILLVATSVGIIPNIKNIGRNHMMGCLLIPVILYFVL
ncbi:MAG: tripartite tricarboxylate transporter permease [archaeon]